MSKTMRVKVEVYVDVDLDAYEREYHEVVGVTTTKADIRSEVKAAVEDHARIGLGPLDSVFSVRYENV